MAGINILKESTDFLVVNIEPFSLLLEPLRHYENKGFRFVVFRRTTPEIRNQGGLWDASEKIYGLVAGDLKEHTLKWDFPSDMSGSFSHLQYDKDVHGWQGTELPLIMFDELTHFSKKQFFYMLSRNRSTCGVKPYVRATTNPDVDSWVREFIDWWIDKDGYPIEQHSGIIRWFVVLDDEVFWADSKEDLEEQFKGQKVFPKSFTFIPAKLSDNKILMKEDPAYEANLNALSKVEKERLLGGNWNIKPVAGIYFKRHNFEEVDAHPPLVRVVRCWDRAATEEKDPKKVGPDWTVGFKLGIDAQGFFYILDIVRERYSAYKVEELIKRVASQDGRKVKIKGFQDPGGAGKGEIEHFVRMLSGYIVTYEKISVNKITAALSASAQAGAGNIKILSSCKNKEAFYREAENFPEGANDDTVDGFSGAFNELTKPQSEPMVTVI